MDNIVRIDSDHLSFPTAPLPLSQSSHSNSNVSMPPLTIAMSSCYATEIVPHVGSSLHDAVEVGLAFALTLTRTKRQWSPSSSTSPFSNKMSSSETPTSQETFTQNSRRNIRGKTDIA
ncbi:hypothetical protein JHK85_053258 [Glycine max]|nr:hypothetical protein JHK85_053258 [Glycine max]